MIEIHIRPQSGGTGLAKPAARTPAQVALMFMHMASIGYGVVGEEDNIWGEAGCCAEFTFLHVEHQWLGLKAALHELRAEQQALAGKSTAGIAGYVSGLVEQVQELGGLSGHHRHMRSSSASSAAAASVVGRTP